MIPLFRRRLTLVFLPQVVESGVQLSESERLPCIDELALVLMPAAVGWVLAARAVDRLKGGTGGHQI